MYLDNILIYSEDLAAHKRHVVEVLERLWKHGLFAKLSKCRFTTDTVNFLGFILGPDEVAMEESRVKAIQEWPVPRTFCEVQVFLEFANFYWSFIANYLKIVTPLTSMLQGSKSGKKSGPYEILLEARRAFE